MSFFTMTDKTNPMCNAACAGCNEPVKVGDWYVLHPRYPTFRIITHALCTGAADYRIENDWSC